MTFNLVAQENKDSSLNSGFDPSEKSLFYRFYIKGHLLRSYTDISSSSINIDAFQIGKQDEGLLPYDGGFGFEFEVDAENGLIYRVGVDLLNRFYSHNFSISHDALPISLGDGMLNYEYNRYYLGLGYEVFSRDLFHRNPPRGKRHNNIAVIPQFNIGVFHFRENLPGQIKSDPVAFDMRGVNTSLGQNYSVGNELFPYLSPGISLSFRNYQNKERFRVSAFYILALSSDLPSTAIDFAIENADRIVLNQRVLPSMFEIQLAIPINFKRQIREY
ncbi:MAG: hypothetical protein JJU23_11715 [Cyclobacteriaceae bacterium]|nr:hypothetical protein [Cyclobacteriaceae bacterium]